MVRQTLKVMSPLDLALAFVARINAHDVPGLAALMSTDHRFVDSLGAVVTGRDKMAKAWSAYFRMVPDYHIVVDRSFADEEQVVLLGSARGTYTRDGSLNPSNEWQTPAAWRALVLNNLIVEWQVYADNEPIRQRMAKASA
jgi:ketosteroid isomerase-like protein